MSSPDLARPHLDIDVTVVCRGLDITGALLVLPQHCQTKVLDQICELLSGGNTAAVVMMVSVIPVVLPAIAKNACKANNNNYLEENIFQCLLLIFLSNIELHLFSFRVAVAISQNKTQRTNASILFTEFYRSDQFSIFVC